METTTQSAPDGQQHGISRSLALGRLLHFEALMRRRLGEVRAQRYVRMHNYYSNQQLPPDNVEQPLGVNYFKSIVDKHTGYLWGQHKKHLFDIRVTPHGKDDMAPDELQEASQYARKVKSLLERIIFTDNKGDITLWEASKNGCLYGDSVLEIRYEPRERRIIIENLLPEYFHCMWEISNMQNITEVIIAYPIDRVVALEQYGTAGNDQFIGYQAVNPNYLPGIGILWKRWSQTSMQVWVDDTCVLNEKNPYMWEVGENVYPGLIPFIHISNMKAGAEFFGYSDGEDILLLQDEYGRRLADMGDVVNIHAHPLITLTKFSGDVEDLPVGPDSVWDLGREGEAKRLESAGPGPEAMGYLQEVKTTMQETSAMPEAAYGTRKGGGSHNSGIALALTMMPVVERSSEKRLYWTDALKRLMKMCLYMLYVRDPKLLESYGIDYPRSLMFELEPIFSDVLPKDELQNVNEGVATYANGIRSLERTLEKLGEEDVQAEKQRILQDMQTKAAMAAPTPPAEGGTAGQNGEQGQGGSASLPGGIGASAGKPGTLIASNEIPQVDNVGMSQLA